MTRRFMLLAAALLALLLQGCAVTMQTAPCDKPAVSSTFAPAAYLIVLPYTYRGDQSNPPEPQAAAIRTLNQLARAEALRMSAETKDMHVTLLEDREVHGGAG
ncbi:MAG: hypothetical protein EON92_19420, partial [Burkholderiales bacterium]